MKNGEGISKKSAIENGTDKDKIFSFSTYKSYYKHCKYFGRYINENHPECTTLKAAKKYVNEWLQYRVDYKNEKGESLSAWTISLERQALCKLYGIEADDNNFFKAPKRKRADIKRSRTDAVRDKHFSVKNNDEFIKFCKGTGCRRNVIEKLEGRDLCSKNDIIKSIKILERREHLSDLEKSQLIALKDCMEHFPDNNYFIHHRRDKGGRERFSPIIGENKEQIINRMKETARYDKVWLHVPKNADIHSYRSDYATAIYKAYARKIEDIPFDKVNGGTGRVYQSQVYHCRKDESGKKLDKVAMLKVSKALGHNRLEIVANNYVRGI